MNSERKLEMTEVKMIREATLRLSCIEQKPYHYDPDNEIFGEGPILFLVRIGDLVLIAWEDNDTGTVILNPITRFDLYALEELGMEESWTLLHVPETVMERIEFLDIDNTELAIAYRLAEEWDQSHGHGSSASNSLVIPSCEYILAS